MENPFQHHGLRSFIVKSVILIVALIGIQLLSSLALTQTEFYKTTLTIPDEFRIEGPNIRTIATNAVLFGFCAFLIWAYHKLKTLELHPFKARQLGWFMLALSALLAHYLLKYAINQNTTYFLQAATFWGVVKIALILLFVGFAALGTYGLPFLARFFKEYRKEIILFVIATVGFFFLMLLVQNLWTVFSAAISKMLFWIFSLFYDNVVYRPHVVAFTMSEGGGPLLGINGFRAIVGKPCSGIDSFLLFTTLYALIFILDYHRLKRPRAIAMFFVGIIGMFLTNLVRIFLLFIIGAHIDAKFAVGLFHTNVGWILFIIYFFVFWGLASKYIYLQGKHPKHIEK